MVSSAAWTRRLQRAEVLAADGEPGGSLLRFYARLLREQKKIHDALDTNRVTGALEADSAVVLESGLGLVQMVSEQGPDALAAEARQRLDNPDAIRGELMTYWTARTDRLFFPKALLQPYAEWLTHNSPQPISGIAIAAGNRCPNCGGAPQLSILEGAAATAGDGSSRSLQCATCLATWPYRRVVCPSCGNEDERMLRYYESPTFSYMRIDA